MKLYLYYDSQGYLVDHFLSGLPRQGDDGTDKVYVYDESLMADSTATLTIQKSNSPVPLEKPMTKELSVSLPTDDADAIKNADLTNFAFYKEYDFMYTYTFESDDLSGASYIELTTRIKDSDNNTYAKGLYHQAVSENVLVDETEMTRSQYESLVFYMSTGLLNSETSNTIDELITSRVDTYCNTCQTNLTTYIDEQLEQASVVGINGGTSTDILALTENMGIYLATDDEHFYNWDSDTGSYVQGPLAFDGSTVVLYDNLDSLNYSLISDGNDRSIGSSEHSWYFGFFDSIVLDGTNLATTLDTFATKTTTDALDTRVTQNKEETEYVNNATKENYESVKVGTSFLTRTTAGGSNIIDGRARILKIIGASETEFNINLYDIELNPLEQGTLSTVGSEASSSIRLRSSGATSLSAGTYTINVTGDIDYVNVKIYDYWNSDSDFVYDTGIDYTESTITFTITESKDIRLILKTKLGTENITPEDFIGTIMLNSGSTALPYGEPGNIAYPTKIISGGRNLFNFENITVTRNFGTAPTIDYDNKSIIGGWAYLVDFGITYSQNRYLTFNSTEQHGYLSYKDNEGNTLLSHEIASGVNFVNYALTSEVDTIKFDFGTQTADTQIISNLMIGTSSVYYEYEDYFEPIEFNIPDEILSITGYGIEGNVLDFENETFTQNNEIIDEVVTALTTPIVTDVSDYITGDTYKVWKNGAEIFDGEVEPYLLAQYILKDTSNYISETKSDLYTISCWGDSITARGSKGVTYPEYLETVIDNPDVTVNNFGVSGQCSGAIAFRQGANTITCVNEFTVPATVTSVSLEITCSVGNVANLSNSATFDNVEIGGILGTLDINKTTVDNVNNTRPATFIRNEIGTETVISSGEQFISSQLGHNEDVSIIWAGRNDMSTSHPYEFIGAKSNIEAMINNLSSKNKRFLIMGITRTTGETDENTAPVRALIETNNYFKEKYPNNFVDANDYLVNQCIYDAGITPTTADLENIANGVPPTSLMADSTHPNEIARITYVDNLIYPNLKSRGWIFKNTDIINQDTEEISVAFTDILAGTNKYFEYDTGTNILKPKSGVDFSNKHFTFTNVEPSQNYTIYVEPNGTQPVNITINHSSLFTTYNYTIYVRDYSKNNRLRILESGGSLLKYGTGALSTTEKFRISANVNADSPIHSIVL